MDAKSLIMLTTIVVFWIILQNEAAPTMNMQNVLDQDLIEPVITSACSLNGRCWQLSPLMDRDTYITSEDPILSREHPNDYKNKIFTLLFETKNVLQTRRQTMNRDSDTSKDDDSSFLEKEMRLALPVPRQISSRLAKKDTHTSRSWGASGMPFSVLYMNPHTPRSNHANGSNSGGTTQQDSEKPIQVSTQSSGQQNYNRVGVRNGAQARRQFSILPQLFISYAWGPSLGK